ncbi:MAG: nucleotidyltransferase domain-containing protein [bacterium]
MKALKELNLKENEIKALQELKEKILERFPVTEIIIYGSKARGDADEESDIDVLILINKEVNTVLEEEIFHMSYEIELKYDVVFGEMVENNDFWNTPLAKAMPLHWNIDREGIRL